MPAIKASGSKGLRIEDCDFSGFETDIELENVQDFVSKNNRFSGQNKPDVLLSRLSAELQRSGLDKSFKERLAKDIIDFLSSGGKDQGKERDLKSRLGYLGNKAVDIFIQLVAAVAAGLVLRQ